MRQKYGFFPNLQPSFFPSVNLFEQEFVGIEWERLLARSVRMGDGHLFVRLYAGAQGEKHR
jgi:hypothetical protein